MKVGKSREVLGIPGSAVAVSRRRWPPREAAVLVAALDLSWLVAPCRPPSRPPGRPLVGPLVGPSRPPSSWLELHCYSGVYYDLPLRFLTVPRTS